MHIEHTFRWVPIKYPERNGLVNPLHSVSSVNVIKAPGTLVSLDTHEAAARAARAAYSRTTVCDRTRRAASAAATARASAKARARAASRSNVDEEMVDARDFEEAQDSLVTAVAKVASAD